MTRIIIFGDLHANLEGWHALQQAEPAPDAVFCLGDIVGYGPDPKRCLDGVRASATCAIGGRHDWAVGGSDITPDSDLLAESWRHGQSVLGAVDCRYLRDLPAEQTVSLAGGRFHLARLQPDNPAAETFSLITVSTAQLQARFGCIEADVIFLGGAHVPAMRQVAGRLIVCPGSLGLPRYGVADPTFAAWEDGRLQIHHLHYHPDATIRKLALLPLAPENTAWLQTTLRTGDRF